MKTYYEDLKYIYDQEVRDGIAFVFKCARRKCRIKRDHILKINYAREIAVKDWVAERVKDRVESTFTWGVGALAYLWEAPSNKSIWKFYKKDSEELIYLIEECRQ